MKCKKHKCKLIYSMSCGQFYCPKCTDEAEKQKNEVRPYSVLITETTIKTRTVNIKAISAEEAENKVHRFYDSGAYNDDLWDVPDDGGVEFEVNELPASNG